MRRGLARLANLAGIAAGGALLAVSWPAPAQVRDVDTREAARSGLRVSSKLLRLARNEL